MNYLIRISMFVLLVAMAVGCRKKDRLPGVTPISVIVKTGYETDGAPYSLFVSPTGYYDQDDGYVQFFCTHTADGYKWTCNL